MKTSHIKVLQPTWALLLIGAVMASTSAMAADKAKPGAAEARYQQERATCMDGRSNQDRATCLREAAAARDQAKRGVLNDGSEAYAMNERKRCATLPDKDRDACIARIDGDSTTTTGSVAAGGILRERVTREPGVPPSPVQSDIDARGTPAR